MKCPFCGAENRSVGVKCRKCSRMIPKPKIELKPKPKIELKPKSVEDSFYGQEKE